MKNKKRLTALLLATVLVCSQVSTIGSPVTAEETELTTEAAEAAETVSEESETATGETVSTSAETADNDAEMSDADSTDAEESADVAEAVTEDTTEAVTESTTGDVAESTEAATEAVSEAEGESEDETETETIEDVNAGISLAGLDLDGSVSAVDEDEEENGENEDSESWWLDVSWPNGTNQLLVDETVSATVYVGHHYYYEDGDDGWWEDEILEADDFIYKLIYDSDAISVSDAYDEDGYGVALAVTGKEEGDARITIRVYIDETQVIKENLDFYVTDSGYYYLTADTSDGIVVPLGADYDLEDCGFTLYYVNSGGTVAVEENDYTLSVTDWEDYCFEALDGMTLLNRIHTDGTYASVSAYDAESGEELAGTGIDFAWLDYGISLSLTDEYLNDYGVYIVYDHEQTIEMSLESLPDGCESLPDGYEVVWDIDDESGLLQTVGSDTGSLTLTVSEANTDCDGWWANVHAAVYYKGNEVCCADRDFEIVIPYVEYDEFGDITVVLGNGYWIDPTIWCYGRSYEEPYGFDSEAKLTSLTIVSQYEYTDDGDQLTDDVISLDGEVGSGWNVNTNKCGYANMLATYVDADGNEQSFEFVIYVSGEYYSLNYAYLEETDGRVQVDGTITIDTSLQYTYTTEEGYADEYTIEDYLDQGFLLNCDYYDDSIISVDDSGSVLSVTGLTEGGTDLYVYVIDEEDNLVADAWLWIEVTQDYYVLSYENDNVALGDTVDVAIGGDVTYTLTHYYTDDSGKKQIDTIELTSENSYIEIEGYDDGCWIWNDDSLKFTRKGNWGTSVDVHVMLYNEDYNENDEDSEEFMEVASCGVWFDELNYNGSLTNDVDTDSWILYTGNEMTISYALEDETVIIPDGAEYKWTVQGWDDEAGDWYDIPEGDAVLSWTDNEDGTITVTLNSAEYGAAYVTMIVNYEDNQIIWAAEWIDTRDERFDVEISVDPWVMLYNDTAVVTATYYLENENNSAGESGDLTITDVEIIGNYTWNDDGDEVIAEYTVATAGTDNEGNWVLTSGTESGVVTLKITYIDPITGEKALTGEDESIRVDVWDSHWYLDAEQTEYDLVISDDEENAEDSAEIEYTVNKGSSVYDEDSEEWTSSVVVIDPLEIDGFTITFDGYDDSIICPVYDSETGTITVYALANGETGLDIYAEDGEGNGFEGIWVYIRVTGQLSGEITVEDEDCEITKGCTDEEFNLADEMGISTNSDAALQYTIIQGSDVVEIDEDGNITIIGVGTAIIKVYVDETNTYTYAKVNVKVNVDKADASITAVDQVVTYGEMTAIALEATTNSDAELAYKVTEGTDVVTLSEGGIVTINQAGVATITISAAETELYTSAVKEITVTVNKADAAITASDKTATYGDDAFSLGAISNNEESDLTYTVTEGTGIVSVAEDGMVTVLKPGIAKIKISAEDTINYNAAEDVTITVTVNKAAASITLATSTQTVTYGQSIVLSADNLGLTVVGDGTPTYTVTSGTDVLSISDSTAATLKAGTAVITVSMAATDKYYAADDVTITVTVNKADGTGSVTITGWVAGETANAPAATSATNGTDNVTYYYKVQGADDSTYTTTVPTMAGSYTVKAVFAATDNYNEVSATSNFTVLDMSRYVELDTNVDDLSDITLPAGWAWVSEQEIFSGTINYVQAENISTNEIITVPVSLIPHITSNDTFTKGEDTSAVIKCSGELHFFKGLKVDGKEVAATSYTATHGSTILTFTEDYMNTLSVGEHTVTLTYETGDLNATLTVLEQTPTETESETTATESETTATESETETETDTEVETETDTEEATETTTTASSESETTGSDSVSTGDETPIATTLAVMLLAASLLIAGAAYRRMYGRRK